MTKGCILPFLKKGDLGIAKNYLGITLTSIEAKIYTSLCYSTELNLKLRKLWERIEMVFEEINPRILYSLLDRSFIIIMDSNYNGKLVG